MILVITTHILGQLAIYSTELWIQCTVARSWREHGAENNRENLSKVELYLVPRSDAGCRCRQTNHIMVIATDYLCTIAIGPNGRLQFTDIKVRMSWSIMFVHASSCLFRSHSGTTITSVTDIILSSVWWVSRRITKFCIIEWFYTDFSRTEVSEMHLKFMISISSSFIISSHFFSKRFFLIVCSSR